MRRRTKLFLAAGATALALSAAVGTATARRFEISEQRFLVLFREVTFQEANGGAATQVICPINFEGSFHSRTIPKVADGLIGYITEARVNRPCQANNAWILNGVEVQEGVVVANTLPWHIEYVSFIGRLPLIEGVGVAITNGGILVKIGAVNCLYEAEVVRPILGHINVAAGLLERFVLNEIGGISKKAGGLLCPSPGFAAGSGPVGTQREWRTIAIRLVQ